MNNVGTPKFLSALQVEPNSEYDDHLWRLTNPLIYSSVVAGVVFTVPGGFVTDFASVPRIVPILYALCGGCADEAAALHDWLYTQHPVDRATADAVFLEACKVTAVPLWRRLMMWAGVRVFGGSHWGK